MINFTLEPYRLFVVFLIVMLCGCASLSPEAPDPKQPSVNMQTVIASPSVSDADLAWWQVGFHRNIEEDEEPAWYMDTLIAYEILKPILERYEQQISLWRFHRRAAADKSGHQFSFIFYSDRRTGELIYQLIKDNDFVQTLENDSYINRLSFVDINGDARSEVEATSDKNWPIELQKAWPDFAMGVSQTWLKLVDEYVQQTSEEDGQDVAAQVERFKEINEKINSVWEQKGEHAFLHHLNALFGYQELYIIERRRTRF